MPVLMVFPRLDMAAPWEYNLGPAKGETADGRRQHPRICY